MRIAVILVTAMIAGLVQGQEDGLSLTDKLIAEYSAIQTVRCDIRREMETGGRRMSTLSRVWFERGDRLRVETVTPDKRKIVVDGKAIYKWVEGHAEGVRIPLDEAAENELMQVRKTPGTAEEYLLRLRDLPEIKLPVKDGFPVRRAYLPPDPHPYTVLAFDEKGRLARVEFFDQLDRTNRLVKVDFGGWKEVKPGLWFPCQQKSEAKGRDGTEVTETLRVSALVVNEPIEPEQFDVETQALGIQFVTTEAMTVILKNKESSAKK